MKWGSDELYELALHGASVRGVLVAHTLQSPFKGQDKTDVLWVTNRIPQDSVLFPLLCKIHNKRFMKTKYASRILRMAGYLERSRRLGVVKQTRQGAWVIGTRTVVIISHYWYTAGKGFSKHLTLPPDTSVILGRRAVTLAAHPPSVPGMMWPAHLFPPLFFFSIVKIYL